MHLKLCFPSPAHLFPIKPAWFLPCRKSLLNLIRRRGAMANFVSDKLVLLSKLKTVRWVTLFLGFSNLGVILLGGFLVLLVFISCSGGQSLPFAVVSILAGIKIMSMIGAGIAQEATASMILSEQQAESAVADAVIRHERRVRYKRWIWWTRFGMAVTVLQFVGATYLMFVIVKYVSYDTNSSGCFLGKGPNTKGWERTTVVFFLVLVWFLVMIQCFTGSDVLRWRSFYETHDQVWKAHYREVFDYGIREALCCMGRVQYLSVLEEDEVYAVARLLGDLVAYRASGTGHLELLAGLALLQRNVQTMDLCEEVMEAPESCIREAVTYHPFAEAAYTGPLLDFGRNPVLFPCVWLYRQGVLTPWSRNRRPVLEGDNWWRGHAAAFLKYVNLSPEALRKGRVSQKKREAAYFIVVVHHLRSVVIAVRGTETPEDLITDGLCRECSLTMEDLDGLLKKEMSMDVELFEDIPYYFIEGKNHDCLSNEMFQIFMRTPRRTSFFSNPTDRARAMNEQIAPEVKQRVLSSFPHYGHSGIVESARELFMQIDGQPAYKDDFSSKDTGLLSSLLRVGSECHGYNVRIVGHSLGGAVSILLGMRLYNRYPNLHVYTYGALPCVNFVIAEACSSFVTSIVYCDEFSARLSVSSILRLRAAAIASVSQDTSANSAMVCKLARRIFNVNKYHERRENGRIPTSSIQTSATTAYDNSLLHGRQHYKQAVKGVHGPGHQRLTHQAATSFPDYPESEILQDGFEGYNHGYTMNSYHDFDNFENCDTMSTRIQPFFEVGIDGVSTEPISEIVDGISSSVEVLNEEHPEMYLPGFIIHILPEQRRSLVTLWKRWKIHDREHNFRAYVVNRENFKDIIVSPYMFLDHLPWRVHYAMQRVLETRKARSQIDSDLPTESHMV